MADQTAEVNALAGEAAADSKKKMIKTIIIVVAVLAVAFVVYKFVLKK